MNAKRGSNRAILPPDLVRPLGMLLVIGVVACRSVVDPLPSEAVPMPAPQAYALWWSLTEACSGVTRDFDAIEWYVVPEAEMISVNGREYHGYAWPESGRIVLAERAILKGALVRHEMLHALAGPGHERKYFLERCGGVVACGGDCSAAVGAEIDPPASASEIDAEDLDVAIRIDLANAPPQGDSGWVALTVSATNTDSNPAWVLLHPVAPGEPASATFGVIIDCISGCGHALSYEFVTGHRIGFGANQSRRLVFDYDLPLGGYFVRGFFNSDTTAAMRFDMRP
jgi:hypothetical protein